MPAGHPPTAEQVDELLNRLREGKSVRDACAFAGVGESSFYHWLRKGREGRGEHYVALARLIDLARAGAVEPLEQRVRASTDWRAAAWLLARLDPESWGENVAAGTAPDAEEHLIATEQRMMKVARVLLGFIAPERRAEATAAMLRCVDPEGDAGGDVVVAEDAEDEPGAREDAGPNVGPA